MLKDTRSILFRAECPYVQFAAARVISTERFVLEGTNGRERDRSQVSDGKVERALRARLLLSCVLCGAWCVQLIRPFSGVPCLPFYRSRGSRAYRWEKKHRPRSPFEGVGPSFSAEPALLTWPDSVRDWHVHRVPVSWQRLALTRLASGHVLSRPSGRHVEEGCCPMALWGADGAVTVCPSL